MNTYPDLYRFAGELEKAWEERERVEWQEAEDLVHQIEKMAKEDRDDLQAILNYADAEDEWNCEEVSIWPKQVMDSLDGSDKDYRYRSSGDEWEVYGVYMSGREDWVATVDTETVAHLLVNAISNPVGLAMIRGDGNGASKADETGVSEADEADEGPGHLVTVSADFRIVGDGLCILGPLERTISDLLEDANNDGIFSISGVVDATFLSAEVTAHYPEED